MYTALRKLLALFLVGFIGDSSCAPRVSFPSCRSSDTCITLTQCRSYMNLIRSLKRPLSSAAVVFLRRQECGFDGVFPMVCCFSVDVAPLRTEPQEPADKPDFTPSDLSDYRLAKAKGATTEKVETTSRFRRRGDPKKESDRKREEALKRKMEAINNAFALSSMDYFFVRRMQDDEIGSKTRIK